MKKFTFLMLSILLIVLSGVAQANAVYNGSQALGDERVVLLTGIAQKNYGCTGSLISPRIVYTAAHCASVAHFVWPPNAIVGSSNSLTPVKVLKSFTPKEFSECVNCGRGPIDDFMILILEKDLAEVSSMRIATVSEIESLKHNQVDVIQIGYGLKQWAPNNYTDAKSNFPERLVSKLRPTPFLQNNKEVEDLLTKKPSAIINTVNSPEKTMCGGDSGGPLYFLHENEYVYVGALSATTGLGCQYKKDDPARANPFWIERTFGVYYVAAYYQAMISDAAEFLETRIKMEKTVSKFDGKKKTITCLKGANTKKKVTAANPICPKGFSKKKN